MAIVDNARDAGVRVMVQENFRWQPWYRKAKALLDEECISTPTHLFFRMRTGDGWGEDAYLSRQPFFCDTFRFLLGKVEEVFAVLKRLNPVIKGEDAGYVCFRFGSGASAILDANRYNESETENPRYTFGEFRLDGTQGHLGMEAEVVGRRVPGLNRLTSH